MALLERIPVILIRRVGIALLRSLIRIGCAGAMPTRAGRVDKIACESRMRCSVQQRFCPPYRMLHFAIQTRRDML